MTQIIPENARVAKFRKLGGHDPVHHGGKPPVALLVVVLTQTTLVSVQALTLARGSFFRAGLSACQTVIRRVTPPARTDQSTARRGARLISSKINLTGQNGKRYFEVPINDILWVAQCSPRFSTIFKNNFPASVRGGLSPTCLLVHREPEKLSDNESAVVQPYKAPNEDTLLVRGLFLALTDPARVWKTPRVKALNFVPSNTQAPSALSLSAGGALLFRRGLYPRTSKTRRLLSRTYQAGGPKANNTSGYKGVFKARGRKWEAKIYHNGRQEYIGSFDTKEMAAKAYDIMARKYFHSGAYLNFPRG